MELYSYFRSSASFRVRIALHLKGLPYDYHAIHLVKGGGEQFQPAFRALNPEGLVPVLVDDVAGERVAITQSLAMLEYLDETHPEPPILPADPAGRARVRSLALVIACEIHPLDNLRVLRYLTGTLGIDEDAKNAWYRHWVEAGLGALEAHLAGSPRTGRFCHGDTPTMADLVLVPQLFNARRMDCDLAHVPTVVRIGDTCMELDAFQRAAPSAQPDAE